MRPGGSVRHVDPNDRLLSRTYFLLLGSVRTHIVSRMGMASQVIEELIYTESWSSNAWIFLLNEHLRTREIAQWVRWVALHAANTC